MRFFSSRTRGSLTIWAVALFFGTVTLKANVVDVGVLSFDQFLPAVQSSPGVNAFNIANFTGSVFSLPPSFPVIDDLTFLGANLQLFPQTGPAVTLSLGDIGPGFLLDAFGNPVVQVPDNEQFTGAEFTAKLSPTSFSLAGGGFFNATSSSIDVVLQPSSGNTLVAGTDFALITVAGSVSAIPEPGNLLLLATVIVALAPKLRRAFRPFR